jgi:hypothetical protein
MQSYNDHKGFFISDIQLWYINSTWTVQTVNHNWMYIGFIAGYVFRL